MRTKRVLQALVVAGSLLAALVLLALAVSALAQPSGVAAVLGATVLALLALRVLTRRVGRGTVLEVDLDNGVIEAPPAELFDQLLNRGAVALRDVVDALDRGADDDRVGGFVARIGNGRLTVAQAQELRDAVKRFRSSGKPAIAFSESFGEARLATADYYLASAFDEIHLLPMGTMAIQGVVTRTPFLKGVFERIGVQPDFDHRREYKAAKYLLTEKGYVPPHEEAATAVLEDHLEQMLSGIAADRGLDRDRVRQAIDGAPLYGSEALEAGLVDRIAHRDQAYEAANGDGKRLLFVDQYLKRAGRPHRRGKRIALIYGTGAINRGSSRLDPLTRGSSFGADDVARAIREAREDSKVSAIVFRVDSPGGSAVGSEVVYREVVRAREAGKPVVVSMGSVAGSGGYFVAASAARIVAQPGTITGSIGVVSGKLATGEAWRRIGLNWAELHIGRNATFSVPDTTYSASERERLTAGLDTVYTAFKDRVATGRSLTTEQAEEVAKGRVWTGSRALELGLVDELGGMDTAIELARELAGIEPGASLNVQVFPRKGLLPIQPAKPSSGPISEAMTILSSLVPNAPVELRMSDHWSG